MFVEAWAYLPHACNKCARTIWWEWGLKEYGYDYYGWQCWRPGMTPERTDPCKGRRQPAVYADEVFADAAIA